MPSIVTHTSTFAHTAADKIINLIKVGVAKQGYFILSLCGGTTPGPVYLELAKRGEEIDWSKVIITFSDERCVPPDHVDSNFRSAKINLFDRIKIPPENILRLKGELDPIEAARFYEQDLETTARRLGLVVFKHDLVILGLGADGHTASLFPGTEALLEKERRVMANFIPKLNAWRLTFTPPFINQSKCVLFLVTEEDKKEVAESVLSGESEYPAARVQPVVGEVEWVVGE